ncbi:MAG: hypothetical protein LBC64_08465 [Fibromonadaceae bacterium]|jgi:hypothetical protein|nr:hypothetical protein [Fibromonadaceae bacterium]
MEPLLEACQGAGNELFCYIEKAMQPALFIILLFFALSFAQEPQEPQVPQEPQKPQSEADKRASLLGTVQVTSVHSLSEAKGSYKSPRRAMFMSLVLPGSGQLYVGGKQSRYIRGIFYLAEEAALISGLYYHSIYKYDKQVKKYQDFAAEHFSVAKYEKAMNEIYDPADSTHFTNLYGQERGSYCNAFYGNSVASKTCVDNFGQNARSNGEPYHPGDNTPLYNGSEYYNAIASENFVLGWDDVNAAPISIIKNNLVNRGNYIPLGSSISREEYLSIRKKANRLADSQALFLGAIILNHLVSAVDAVLSARAHNNSLYENKISFLDNIRLNSDFNIGENFKAETAVVYLF